MSNEPIEIPIDEVLHETDGARKYLIGENKYDDDDCLWVPKSLIQNDGNEESDGCVEVPTWWAEQEGLI